MDSYPSGLLTFLFCSHEFNGLGMDPDVETHVVAVKFRIWGRPNLDQSPGWGLLIASRRYEN